MEDAEQATSSKNRTSTPRTLKHQQRAHLLIQVVERAVLTDPALRQSLTEAMIGALDADPALAEAFGALFRPEVPGPPVLLATNALVTGVLNTQRGVLNTVAGVLNGAPSGRGQQNGGVVNTAPVAPAPSPPAPSRPLSPPHPSSPPRNPTLLAPTPTGGTIPTPAAPGRRDPVIDAYSEVFAEGDYANLSDREMGMVLTAKKKLGLRASSTGRSIEEMADGVRVAARNWPNVMGDRPMTIPAIADNWARLVHGPQTGGRSNGIIHHQDIYESGAIRRQESFSQMEARNRRKP